MIFQKGSVSSHRTALTLLLSSWILSLLLALPPLFGWGAYLPESAGIRQEQRRQQMSSVII
jgi:hypothetical protein